MKCSDRIADFLKEKNVSIAFGIIGSGNAHIFDSISRLGFTEIICVHHEQAAVMAAMTYYRVAGKVAAVLPTTGAGSTNAVTGVVSAWMDSIPCFIISGNENSKFTSLENPLRIWGVQGYASSEMVSQVTKYSSRAGAENLDEELYKSWEYMLQGRPGPVWLDVPMNIQAAQMVPALELSKKMALSVQKSLQEKNDLVIKQNSLIDVPELGIQKIADALKKAQRPVLWLGHGIRLSHAEHLVRPLVEKLGVPVLVSWAGADLLDSEHPLCYGRAGVYGLRASNFVLQNCDFLLGIGTRFAMPQVGYDISEFARAAQIAVVDIDPTELSKYRERFTLPILSDAGTFMKSLIDTSFELGSYTDWIKTCNMYRESYPALGPEHADKNGFLNSYQFMWRLPKYFSDDQLVVTDMGTALLSGHQLLRLRGRQRLMTSTGLGEMGFGLPAAIGASFARSREEVLCLNCDGGMMMNLQELQTIAHHQLPIKIVVFNNDGYLMIKHTQKALFKGHYTSTDKKSGVSCPNFSKLAAAFDFPAFQVRSWQDFEDVMPKFFDVSGPSICEVFMDPEQLFVPKLSLAPQPDGSIISPPLEDLSPLLPRDELEKMMIIGLHPKSKSIKT